MTEPVTITEFTGTVSRISAGVSGQGAIDALNKPIEEIESHLNTLATRIANTNSKSAIIRKYAPLSPDVAVGDLVYYNSEQGHNRFEPALAALMAEAGARGESVEAPSARVEGMVLSIETERIGATTVLGTLLCGGYWESESAITGCLGDTNAGKPGVYYLSHVVAGKAVDDTEGHLRQPILSNYGGGKFNISIMCMAHDNHFHGSHACDDAWTSTVTPPENVSAVPDGALFWYNGSGNPLYENIGELSAETTAIFYNGMLMRPSDGFMISEGYLWYMGDVAPATGSVVIFNHYPFAYGSPVVRSIESANGMLSVQTKNGVVRLTAMDLKEGTATDSATALHDIRDGVKLYTRNVSDVVAGPGIVVSKGNDASGVVVVASKAKIGERLDAYAINHNGTNITSDSAFTYITFPAGRDSALSMSMPITGIEGGSGIVAQAWAYILGQDATFDVTYYWTPDPEPGAPVTLSWDPVVPTCTMTADVTSSTSSTLAYAVASAAVPLTGNGTLTAVVHISNIPTNDIRLPRLGFILSYAE